MSRNLFQRKTSIPFKEQKEKINVEVNEDDLDNFDEFAFGGKKKSSVRSVASVSSAASTPKTTEIERAGKRSLEEDNETSKKKQDTSENCVVLTDSHEEAKPKSSKRNTRSKATASKTTNKDFYDTNDVDDIPVDISSNPLLQRFDSLRRTASTTSSSSQATYKDTMITTDILPTYSVPKVLTATERQKLTEEYKLKTTSKRKSISNKATIDFDEDDLDDSEDTLRIKTRLLGSDEMLWMINPTQSFQKVYWILCMHICLMFYFLLFFVRVYIFS